MTKIYPEWVDRNARIFKQRKRNESRQVLKAVQALFYGSAFLPRGASAEVRKLRDAAREIGRLLSIKEWGR